MKLEGWKAVAKCIAEVWGRAVSVRSAQRYEREQRLPVARANGRLVANSARVTAWATSRVSECGAL